MPASAAARIGLAAAVWIAATPAVAHIPPEGFDAVMVGTQVGFHLPPLGLAAFAVGLLSGQQGERVALAGAGALLLGFAAAAAALFTGTLPVILPIGWITGIGLATALLVTIDMRRIAPVAVGLALATGAVAGLTAPPHPTRWASIILESFGQGLGLTGIACLSGLAASVARESGRGSHRIAIRALGAWVAAVAIIMLALEVAAPIGG